MLHEQPSTEQQPVEGQLNPPVQTSTPSDKSTESPQDIKSLIQTTMKKESSGESRSITLKQSISEERRSTTSKHYTSEWLASQKPEEAIPGNCIYHRLIVIIKYCLCFAEDVPTLPPLVTLPTLVSTQPSTNNLKSSNASTSSNTSMLSKLPELMSKLIQKKTDGTGTLTSCEYSDPIAFFFD